MPEPATAPLERETPPPGVDAAPPLGSHRLLQHTGIYALTTFVLRGLNFLLLALYSRYLLPAEYGRVVLAETMAAVVFAAGSLGLGGAFRRLYFQSDQQPERLRDFVATSLWLSTLAALAFLALATLLAAAVERFARGLMPVPWSPYVALALVAAAATTLVELRLGLWQVERRPARFAQFAVLVFTLTTAAVVLTVVVFRHGAVGMLAGKALAGGLCAIAALALSRHWLQGAWRAQDARELLHLGLPLVPHQLLALGLVAADRFILARYRDLNEVGLYSMAYTLGMAMFLVTSALMLAWSPVFYDLARGDAAQREKLARLTEGLMLALAAIATLGTLIAQDFTRVFLEARYAAAGRLVPWVIAGYLLHALFSLMQLHAMQVKRSGLVMATSSVALVANIALNLWWVPRWGMNGSAWATTAAYALEAAMMLVLAQRLFPLRLSWSRLVLAGTVYGGVLAASQYAPPAERGAWLAVAAAAAALAFALLAAPYLRWERAA